MMYLFGLSAKTVCSDRKKIYPEIEDRMGSQDNQTLSEFYNTMAQGCILQFDLKQYN